MKVRVGTSGYSYKEWKGHFYPEKIKNDEMLRFYGERLTSVEINNTFYRMPKEEVVRAWGEQVPDDFRFVLKASRRITHFGRLSGVEEETTYFLKTASVLGPKLGVLLFQLPPNLKKDLPRLEAFLATLPKGIRAAFEFRHESWFEDDVFDALRKRGRAMCVADTEEGGVPFVSTADWGYLRLRRPDYPDADLRSWKKKVDGAGWSEAFVFFKHEDEGAGPRMAARFLELAKG